MLLLLAACFGRASGMPSAKLLYLSSLRIHSARLTWTVHVLRSELVAASASPLQPVKWSSQQSF